MLHKEYSNFVKQISSEPQPNLSASSFNRLSGEEAKRLYLEEIKDVTDKELPVTTNTNTCSNLKSVTVSHYKRNLEDIDSSNTNLFLSAQNNDVTTLKDMLNAFPDKISTVDEFGWSLLMIACQANSIEVVKELLKRGIDTSVRDKAGNSARTLVIKNKNVILAGILLNTNKCEPKSDRNTSVRLKEEFLCEVCNNKVFPDKQDHLFSTIHNINASKGKKTPAKFMIPPSNIGYQIMLKGGWDNESGLGRDGCGKKYPVKAIQKLDRKGLGLKKRNTTIPVEKHSNRSKLKRTYYEDKRFEANFRREFY